MFSSRFTVAIGTPGRIPTTTVRLKRLTVPINNHTTGGTSKYTLMVSLITMA